MLAHVERKFIHHHHLDETTGFKALKLFENALIENMSDAPGESNLWVKIFLKKKQETACGRQFDLLQVGRGPEWRNWGLPVTE